MLLFFHQNIKKKNALTKLHTGFCNVQNQYSLIDETWNLLLIAQLKQTNRDFIVIHELSIKQL
jgi:hypothetical protein